MTKIVKNTAKTKRRPIKGKNQTIFFAKEKISKIEDEQKFSNIPLIYNEKKLEIVTDTEYNTVEKIVYSIQFKSKHEPEKVHYIDKVNIDENFCFISELVKKIGGAIPNKNFLKNVTNGIHIFTNEMYSIYGQKITTLKIRKHWDRIRQDENHQLYKVSKIIPTNILNVHSDKQKVRTIEIKPDDFEIEMTGHFGETDFTKILSNSYYGAISEHEQEIYKGKDENEILVSDMIPFNSAFKTSPHQMTKNRVLSIQGKNVFFVPSQNKWYKIKISIKDTMYRLGKATSLSNLGKTFTDIRKKTNPLLEKHKSDIGFLYENHFDLFIEYGCFDVLVTEKVDEKMNEYFKKLCIEYLEIEPFKLKNTVGSSVQEILISLMVKTIGVEKKEIIKGLKDSSISNNENRARAGYKSLLTIGGMTYTKCLSSHIKGLFLDLDLSSCYATAISHKDSLYFLGKPEIDEFPKRNLKWLLNSGILDEYEKNAFYITVSGKYQKFFNGLIPSNISLKKAIDSKKINSIDEKIQRDTIHDIDKGKTSKKTNETKYFTNEIHYGIVNSDTLKCISFLPENIKNDFYENSYITQLTGYKKSGEKLTFQIGKETTKIKERRSLLKKQMRDEKDENKKNVLNILQNFLKTILNTMYGVNASSVMLVQNTVFANNITAKARSYTYCMTVSLNGLMPVTDGTAIDLDRIPKYNFKTCLKIDKTFLKNPDQKVLSNESEIKNICVQMHQTLYKGEMIEYDILLKQLNNEIVKHLKKFFCDNTDFFNLYEYEPKMENGTVNGEKKTFMLFDTFYNYGSSSYIKEYKGILLTAKLRSYYLPSNIKESELVKWFVKTLSNNKYEPYVHIDEKMLKLSDCLQAITKELKNGTKKQDLVLNISHFQTILKIPKLISDSQFLFTSYKDYKNFLALKNGMNKEINMENDTTEKIDLGIDSIMLLNDLTVTELRQIINSENGIKNLRINRNNLEKIQKFVLETAKQKLLIKEKNKEIHIKNKGSNYSKLEPMIHKHSA